MPVKYKYIGLIFIVLTLCVCKKNQQPRPTIAKKELEQILLDANILQVAYDTQRVVSFIRLNQWNMQQTKTGIWYEILDSDISGPTIKEGDYVAIDYTVTLMDGSIRYSSKKTGAKTFQVSLGGVENGLEDGIVLLRGGDSARFIMPQYRAHHLLGDGNKIPPLATIIYNLRVVEVASNNNN